MPLPCWCLPEFLLMKPIMLKHTQSGQVHIDRNTYILTLPNLLGIMALYLKQYTTALNIIFYSYIKQLFIWQKASLSLIFNKLPMLHVFSRGIQTEPCMAWVSSPCHLKGPLAEQQLPRQQYHWANCAEWAPFLMHTALSHSHPWFGGNAIKNNLWPQFNLPWPHSYAWEWSFTYIQYMK